MYSSRKGILTVSFIFLYLLHFIGNIEIWISFPISVLLAVIGLELTSNQFQKEVHEILRIKNNQELRGIHLAVILSGFTKTFYYSLILIVVSFIFTPYTSLGITYGILLATKKTA